jgi:hypothetical protein
VSAKRAKDTGDHSENNPLRTRRPAKGFARKAAATGHLGKGRPSVRGRTGAESLPVRVARGGRGASRSRTAEIERASELGEEDDTPSRR